MIEIIYALVGLVIGSSAVWFLSVKTLQKNLDTKVSELDSANDEIKFKDDEVNKFVLTKEN